MYCIYHLLRALVFVVVSFHVGIARAYVLIVPGGTQLHLSQHVPHALKHILWRDAFLHLTSHAAGQSVQLIQTNKKNKWCEEKVNLLKTRC